jgi:16S rRNA (cytosine1402-N4)-methyltransferase
VGIDRDAAALEAAEATLRPFRTRVTLRRARFDQLSQVLADLGHERITAALFDLGVSSPQLDRAERGFSYRHEGPLDMRQDQRQRRTAADVVNGYPADELARVLRTYGDERFATRIARAIVAARPLATTTELAGVVRDAIPAAARRTGGHPAKRTFQAVRIEVNGELDKLPVALDDAIDATVPLGRVAVLTYHSGEDRLVKQRFTEAASGACTCPPGLPCVCGAVPTVRRVRAPRTPSDDQAERNRRARSARLRVVEKLELTV